MKVLFTISCLNYGGAEKNLVLIANYLCQRHEVIICNFNEHDTKQKLDTKIKCFNKDREQLSKKKFAWVGLRKRQLAYLSKICRKEKPDVIVSFLPMPNALAVICGKILRIPVVISERADPYYCISRLDTIIHKVYTFADGAVFQTQGAKEFYSDSLQKKSTIIPNPVMLKETMLKHNTDSANKEIVHVGRFENKQKRQDIMLQAMQMVIKYHPDYKLVFWGDGPDEGYIKKMVEDLKLSNNIEFKGVSTNILEDINKSEIFALSSDYEGIPNVLMEAMSIGMPCVSTDCSPGGARMLLSDGEAGILVKCGDFKELAKKICWLIENKEKEKYFGEKAYEIRDRFNFDVIMERWENYLEKIVEDKR